MVFPIGSLAFRSRSTNVDLPERADVIVSDLSGVLPLFGRHIPAIIDARERFLAPAGTLIARQDHLRGAIIETSERYHKLVQPWNENPFGLDLSAGWPLVANTWISLADKHAKLLTPASDLAVIDYRKIKDSNMEGELAWTMEQPGTGHGAAVWFDQIIADGIKISNEPSAPEAFNTSEIYGQAFFPWLNSIELELGDRVSFRMRADLVKDDYIWRWETIIRTPEPEGRSRLISANRHFTGSLYRWNSLKKREAESIPTANENTQIDAFILSKIDGHTSIGQIAHALAANFPTRLTVGRTRCRAWEI